MRLQTLTIAMFVLLPLWAGAEEFTGRVVTVHDADTISVKPEGEDEYARKVQLNEIDCPEFGQPYGREATNFVRELLSGKDVTVKSSDTDRYGRYLGTVIYQDKDVSVELLKAGLAWWYKRYSKNEKLGELEAAARRAKKGLWADANPVPPWQWRQREKASQRKN